MRTIQFSEILKAFLSATFFMIAFPVIAQEDPEKGAREARKYMSEAKEALEEEDFASAEAFYRQAIAKDPSNASARYNLGNLYMEEKIPNEAVDRHTQAADITEEKPLKHKSFHNKGNAFMEQKKYAEAIEAYKNALRSNPNDDETRYNLALAKKMLEKENPDQGNDNNKEGENENDKDKKQEQDQQGDKGEQEEDQDGQPEDDQSGDQKKKNPKEEEGEGEQKKQQEQEQKDEEGEKPEEQQQPQQQQPTPGQLSPQQIKNLLEAMGNEEKKVQEKMNAEKIKGVPKRTEKDW